MVSRWVPDRQDIIWIDCSPQAGREMKDRHPLLVLSARAFNDRTSLVIGLPMTTAASNAGNPFAVHYAGADGTDSYVLCHQPKSFDWRARDGKPHPWKQAPPNVFTDACGILDQIIAIGA